MSEVMQSQSEGITEEMPQIYSRQRALAGNIGVLLMTVGLSSGAGFIGGSLADYMRNYQAPGEIISEEDIVVGESQYESIIAERDRLPSLDEQIPESFSTACSTILEVYTTGTLSRTAEDSAVADILEEENQPCGDSPREVREKLVVFSGIVDGLNTERTELHDAATEAKKQLESDKTAYEEYKDDDNFRGSLAGLKAGALFGVLASLYTIRESRRTRQSLQLVLQEGIEKDKIHKQNLPHRIDKLTTTQKVKAVRSYSYYAGKNESQYRLHNYVADQEAKNG